MLNHHQLAGSDKDRAAALMEVFLNKRVDGIFCARGGLGSYRILEHLDWEKIAAHPKVFCGFSDITTLLHAMYKKIGLVTFHGPVVWNFSFAHDPQLVENLVGTLENKLTGVPQKFAQATVVRPGSAEGPLIGGNITLLQHLIGTEYDFDTEGAILFLEDTEEKLSDTDRALHHFAMAGKFSKIKGLIMGSLTRVKEEGDGAWGEKLEEVLQKLVPGDVPIVSNFPCGHGKMLATFPIGTKARLDAAADGVTFTLVESPFA
jgi:muramoyltetrapeptide carboxypeptidase